MKLKWYLGTFLLLLAYFGALQDQVSIPNQEIVLEFVDSSINKNTIKFTIADVKQKLLKLGVTSINIEETKSTTLKISYYSLVDVDDVKNVLEENQVVLNQHPKNKSNNIDSDYNIDVYDINEGLEISSTKDNCIIEIKSFSTRFTTNYTYVAIKTKQIASANLNYKTAFKFYKSNPFVKDHTSHKEPEVRAGPNVFTI